MILKKIVSGNLLKIQCSECSIQKTGKISSCVWHRKLEIDTFKLCLSGMCVGLLTCVQVQRPEKGIQLPGARVQAVVNHAERVLISAPARAAHTLTH